MGKIFTVQNIRFCLSAFIALFVFNLSQAQFVERWSSISSTPGSNSAAAKAIMVSPDGNIVASGINKIIKYTNSGKIIWTADVPVNPATNGQALAQDPAGNIYVAAFDFFEQFTASGNYLVSKYNSDGQLIWSRVHDGPSGLEDIAVGIGVDQFGNVYVSGTTLEGISAFDATPRIHTIKFNADGDLQWAQTFHTGASSQAQALVVDFFTGDVYVAGSTSLPKDGDILHLDDFTTIKYNTDGVEQWSDFYNGSLQDQDGATAITLDKDGNVLVTGFSNETINSDFFAGTTVINTFKYDRTNGDVIWHKRFGRDQDDNQNFFEGRATGIATDGDDNVVVIGATARARWHTIKYQKSDGKTLWIHNFDNPDLANSETEVGFDVPNGVAFDKQNNVYVTGFSKFIKTGLDMLTIKYRASDGNELNSASFDNGDDESSADIAIDAKGNAFITGEGLSSLITISYGVCSIVCPQDTTVNNDAGKCSAVVNFTATTTGNCGTLVFTEGQNTVKSGDAFSVGQHTIVVTSPSTGETCSFKITVVDNEKPVITQCAPALTVSCAASVPAPDISLIKATDNCGTVTITSDDVVSNKTCANRFTITRTYKVTDIHGNFTTCTQTITVNDDVPPRILNFSLSKEILSPPNHKMQDVTLNYDLFDNCVSNLPVTITITSNEPVNGTADGDTDPDWIVIDPHHIQLRAERSATGNGRIYTVTVTADDGCNPAVSVTKQVVVAHNITSPQTGGPFKVGSTVNLAGVFWDNPLNKHTAKWLLDSSTIVPGNVVEPTANQNGKSTASYKFNSAGVYRLQMNTTDQNGNTSYTNMNNDLDAFVVIYDPNGGSVYGGGWFNSPPGALTPNPSATGKVSYGFAVNYKNSVKPTGETEFEFKNGSFEFNAVNFDYLVINGAMAQFRGTGKITGGQSGIGFIMTVIDGALNGTGVDKIRMKIYNRNTGAIIYDNQPGASDVALPTTAVGPNSVVVIQGPNVSTSTTVTKQDSLVETETKSLFNVSVFPNPSDHQFTLQVTSGKKDKITMQVFDQVGRLMELRENIVPGTPVKFGDNYRPGAYLVRITQGTSSKDLKLIKIQ